LDPELFFGEGNIVFKHPSAFESNSPLLILYRSKSIAFATAFLGFCLLFSINGIFFKLAPRLTAFLAWMAAININYAVYPTLTGGDYLFQQLLFFNIFLSAQKEINNPSFLDADKALHNFGVTAIKIQVCLVYFISGLAKVLDETWLSGQAISQICRIEDFGIPFLYEDLWQQGGLLKFLNYFILFYQLSFPVLIWFKKIKTPLIVLGVLQHLYIAFFMGLPSFGFIMIIAYTIFYFPKLNKSS